MPSSRLAKALVPNLRNAMVSGVVAIIQARMGSTRLPRKVMMEVCGKPAIWHVVQRVKRSKMIGRVVVATTTEPLDDPLVAYCQDIGIPVFRGSTDDVLDRYYHTARENEAETVVRITADDILIDPEIIDLVIDYYLRHCDAYDYVSNGVVPSYPEGIGVEVFSFGALRTAWKEARKRSEREHVTPYLYTHPGLFRVGHITNPEDLSSYRWTLDYPSDLEFMRRVYARLYRGDGDGMHMQDVIALLKKEPELLELTQGIHRNEGYLKSLKEDNEPENLG